MYKKLQRTKKEQKIMNAKSGRNTKHNGSNKMTRVAILDQQQSCE